MLFEWRFNHPLSKLGSTLKKKEKTTFLSLSVLCVSEGNSFAIPETPVPLLLPYRESTLYVGNAVHFSF